MAGKGRTKVAEFLKSRGSNQTEAATVIGITPQSLSLKANGRMGFWVSEVMAMAKHYHMTDEEIKYVFFERED